MLRWHLPEEKISSVLSTGCSSSAKPKREGYKMPDTQLMQQTVGVAQQLGGAGLVASSLGAGRNPPTWIHSQVSSWRGRVSQHQP